VLLNMKLPREQHEMCQARSRPYLFVSRLGYDLCRARAQFEQ
jgi:hypothetical protein